MQTPFPPVDLEYFPLSCTVCLSQEGMIGTGKVWAFYPESCHVESALAISPGMVSRCPSIFLGERELC
jgi:hypothetical protein